MSRKDKRSDDPSGSSQLFQAEAVYAESIFRMSLGDLEASIAGAGNKTQLSPRGAYDGFHRIPAGKRSRRKETLLVVDIAAGRRR